MLHTIRSNSRGQRILENMRANSTTTGFARVRATDIFFFKKKKLPVAVALTPPSGFANAVTRAPMNAGVSSGTEAPQRRRTVSFLFKSAHTSSLVGHFRVMGRSPRSPRWPLKPILFCFTGVVRHVGLVAAKHYLPATSPAPRRWHAFRASVILTGVSW